MEGQPWQALKKPERSMGCASEANNQNQDLQTEKANHEPISTMDVAAALRPITSASWERRELKVQA